MSHICCNGNGLPPGWTCEEVEVTPCTIYVESFKGEPVPDVQPFKSISIVKTECCDLTVVLDGQVFFMPACTNSHTLQFDCDVFAVELIGDCVDSTNITVMNNTPAVFETVCTYEDPNTGPSPGEIARFPCRFNNCP